MNLSQTHLKALVKEALLEILNDDDFISEVKAATKRSTKRPSVRKGWAAAFKRMSKNHDDRLLL
jgi:hypothetical protein